jgi:hypothetical protein
MEGDGSPVWLGPVLKKVNALPGSEEKATIRDRDRQMGLGSGLTKGCGAGLPGLTRF